MFYALHEANPDDLSYREVESITTLVGYDIPAGSAVFLNFAADDRQADVFPEPDRFDIHRANSNRHISFGKGVHYCLGPSSPNSKPTW